jgi:hypothetical protein
MPQTFANDAPSRLDRDRLEDSGDPDRDDRSCVRFLRTSSGGDIAATARQCAARAFGGMVSS